MKTLIFKTAFILSIAIFGTQISCKKNSSNSPKHTIGENFEGGTIIYLLQDGDPGYDANVQHGLIVSKDDLGFGLWGCKGTGLAGADSKLIGDGGKNTTEILAGCSTAGIAAKLCADYSVTEGSVVYDDWYLPSANELDKINANKASITINSTNYWSSTEAGVNYAWSTNFSTGVSNTALKDEIFRVRAIRSF